MPPHYGLGNGTYNYRERALQAHGAKCNRCGYDKNVAGLAVHHIDHNRANNDLSNLEVICGTCHHIEHWE